MQALPAISPRVRARLLAVLLAIHLALVLVYLFYRLGWAWLVIDEWPRVLDPAYETGYADQYSGLLFYVVAALAAAQALRSPPPRSGPRWLWIVGWLSAATFIAIIAIEEVYWRVETNSIVGPALGLRELRDEVRWMLAAAPIAALPAAAACRVLWIARRGHPARALLIGLMVVLSLAALIRDATEDMLVNRLLGDWLGYPQEPDGLPLAFEEGAEVMAAAALGVLLIEMLAARRDAPALAATSRCARVSALAVAIALLAVSAVPLVSHRLNKGDGWETTAPWSYTGPVTLIEQPFRAHQDNLSRIDVWAFVDGGPPGSTAEIFARLTPEGSDRPVRESRATVAGARFSNATATFDFAPLRDSSGQVYTLAVGVLSGPTPFVFLGMTGGDAIPEGSASVNGAATSFGNDLAMRTAWNGRTIDGLYPRDLGYWGLIDEVILNLLVWVWLVVIVWSGLSGRRPRFWRRFVWPSLLTSALVTACIAGLTLAFVAVQTPAQLT